MAGLIVPPFIVIMGRGTRFKIIWSLFLILFLWNSYFFNLLRYEHSRMVIKQRALENIKAIAIPGSVFLKNLGGLYIWKSSIFYLGVFGILIISFLTLCLFIRSMISRGIVLLIFSGSLIYIMRRDANFLSFTSVTILSFLCFYLITFGIHLKFKFSLKETAFISLIFILIVGALVWGAKRRFFLKTRDVILFNTSIGRSIINFYYTYSPLATAIITPKKGIYEALIYYDALKMGIPLYLGDGIFVSGIPKIKNSADFILKKRGSYFMFESPGYGKVKIKSINPKEIQSSIKKFFHHRGLLKICRVGLYSFLAGIFFLIFFLTYIFVSDKRVFYMISSGIGIIILITIVGVSLMARGPINKIDMNREDIKSFGLALSYNLMDREKINESYLPVIEKMAYSSSPALRYWGAYLLGKFSENDKIVKILKSLIKDKCLNVRYSSAVSLFKISGQKAFKSLVQLLFRDPSWYVRCKIFQAFLKAGMIPSPVMPGAFH